MDYVKSKVDYSVETRVIKGDVESGKVFELCLSSPRSTEKKFVVKLLKNVANCKNITHRTWL